MPEEFERSPRYNPELLKQKYPELVGFSLSSIVEFAKEKDAPKGIIARAYLYDRYFSYAYNVAHKWLKNSEDAEETAQECFIDVFRNLTNFHMYADDSFLKYIAVSALHAANDLAVYKSRRPITVPIQHILAEGLRPDQFLPFIQGDNSPESKIEQEEEHRELKLAVSKLSPAKRSVITLRFFSDMSVSETASALGKFENTVKVLQSQAVKQLRATLNETCP